MFQRIVVAAAPLVVILLTGCPSLSTLQTPATVPKGSIRFGLGLEVIVAPTVDDALNAAPQLEVNARIGVTDNVDIGAKLFFLGAEVGAKYQFMKGRFEGAFAPALSYYGGALSFGSTDVSVRVVHVHLPFLFGLKLLDSFEIVFGPKLLYTNAAIGDPQDQNQGGFLAGGGYGGIQIRIAREIWIAPEVNAYVSLDSHTALILQGGLGLMFGGPPADANVQVSQR